MKVERIHAIATAACRDASNGPDFIAKAEQICRVPIEILSGQREAYLSAVGVVSGVHKPDGVVGDLGGGSLELIDVKGHRIRRGLTLPLGGLALLDASKNSLKRAERIVKTSLDDAEQLKAVRGRTFYAVGGTWRALARIHIIQSGYPLMVMHGYSISAAAALDFVKRVRRLAPANMLANVEDVTDARRPLLAYAALVLEYVIRVGRPKNIVFSTYGVREGLLFEVMPERERIRDGLIATAEALNEVRSRDPKHAIDLIDWTDRFVKVSGLRETPDDRRLRHVACLLSDIAWRAHPDHRGEQAISMITNGNFGSITHAERVFLALAIYYRYAGLNPGNEPPQALRDLLSHAMLERARVLGAMFRVAHLLSGSRHGVLPYAGLSVRGRALDLTFAPRIEALAMDRVASRFKQLARLVGRSGKMVVASR